MLFLRHCISKLVHVSVGGGGIFFIMTSESDMLSWGSKNVGKYFKIIFALMRTLAFF